MRSSFEDVLDAITKRSIVTQRSLGNAGEFIVIPKRSQDIRNHVIVEIVLGDLIYHGDPVDPNSCRNLRWVHNVRRGIGHEVAASEIIADVSGPVWKDQLHIV